MKPRKPILEVVCALIEHQGRLLAAQLAADAGELNGRWEFPGGKVEAQETPEVALIREIQEELCIEIQVVQPLGVVYKAQAGRIIRLQPFRARWLSGEIQLTEHAQIFWGKPASLLPLRWLSGNLEMLKQWLIQETSV